MSESPPISWRSILYGTTVVSSDRTPVGKVREVLGSDADDIASLSADAVSTDLTAAEVDGLQSYNAEATYHLASVGWLRKHIGWRDDSKSDEEPG